MRLHACMHMLPGKRLLVPPQVPLQHTVGGGHNQATCTDLARLSLHAAARRHDALLPAVLQVGALQHAVRMYFLPLCDGIIMSHYLSLGASCPL